jgi:hypothetical protein
MANRINDQETREATRMTKWEYRILMRTRSITRTEAGDQVGQWDKNIIPELPGLGDEGWELVTVISRSSDAHGGRGGVTTEEQWVLKRPKNEISDVPAETFETT